MDVLTPEQRHKNMQNIRSRDSAIELMLRKALWNKGYRYRKNWKELPGTPDIVLTKYRIVIFCDSEYFHGKDWEELQQRIRRGNNPDFWEKKISGNMKHDLDINAELKGLGWKVIRFWGKDIKKDLDGCIRTVEDAILEQKCPDEIWEEE